jgi:hypothetical protein
MASNLSIAAEYTLSASCADVCTNNNPNHQHKEDKINEVAEKSRQQQLKVTQQ